MLQRVKNLFENEHSQTDRRIEEHREFDYYEPGDEEVFNLELTEEELVDDLEDRREAIHRVKIQIRNHWKRYKEYLNQVSGEIGADRVEAEALAKNEKAAAKDKEQLFKELIQEYLVLSDTLRKHFRRKFWQQQEERGYRFDFGDVDIQGFRSQMEDVSEIQQMENHRREEFQRELKLTEEDVELDLQDIQKDVEELEFQDFEIEWDNEPGQTEDDGVHMSDVDWSAGPGDSELSPDLDNMDT